MGRQFAITSHLLQAAFAMKAVFVNHLDLMYLSNEAIRQLWDVHTNDEGKRSSEKEICCLMLEVRLNWRLALSFSPSSENLNNDESIPGERSNLPCMHRQQVNQLAHQIRSATIFQTSEKQSQFAKKMRCVYLEAILNTNEIHWMGRAHRPSTCRSLRTLTIESYCTNRYVRVHDW